MIVAGTYYAALSCNMRSEFSAITAMIVGTSPSLRVILNNSSDALYATFLVLSFGWAAREICGIACGSPSRPMRYWTIGILLSALALSRNDGVIVAPLTIIFLGLLLKWKHFPLLAILSRLGIAITFFSFPLVSWCMIHGLQSRDWSTHIAERSYVAFCQGQNILFLGQFIDSPALPTAESIFGSAQENHSSFLRAIASHPRAFLHRMKRIPANAVQSFIVGVGGKAEFGATFALLFIGLGSLLVQGNVRSLLLFAVFLSPMAVYPFTFFRGGYFAMNFPIMCVVSVSGIALYLQSNDHKTQQKMRIAAGCLACGLALNFIQVWRWVHAPLLLFNDINNRKWIAELQNSIAKDTRVISVDPSFLWYAHLESNDDYGLFLRLGSKNELVAYMQQHGLEYVALDEDMRQYYPRFAALVKSAGWQPIIMDAALNATVYHLSTERER